MSKRPGSASRIAIGILFLLLLVGCAPSDPVGQEVGTRKSSDGLEFAIGLCADERVTRVVLYRDFQGAPTSADVIWEVAVNNEPAEPRRNFRIGSQDGFDETLVPLDSEVPAKFTLAIFTNSRQWESSLEQEDFPKVKENRWETDSGSVRVDELGSGAC